MGVLVEDMLLLARLDQQRPLEHRPVDLLTLAADAVQDARMIAPDRDISSTSGSGAAFLVLGDEVRLRQVIGNLMSNALNHTPDGTPVDGRGSCPARASRCPACVLEVADQGPGCTPEQAEHVFERFYRGRPGPDQEGRRHRPGPGHRGRAGRRARRHRVAEDRARQGRHVPDHAAAGSRGPRRPADDGPGRLAQHGPGQPGCRLGPPAGRLPRRARAPAAGTSGTPGRPPSGRTPRSRNGPQPRAAWRRPAAAVTAAEQAGVHQQRMQLVQRDPAAPAVGQRGHVLVGTQDPVQVRRAEQGQHGQVGLPVAALRGRVDQPAPAAGPQRRCRTSSRHGSGWAARAARPGWRSG